MRWVKIKSKPSSKGASGQWVDYNQDFNGGRKGPKKSGRKWAPYAVCKSGSTPQCATSFMDVSRILSGKQPTCKFCNTAWDPTQYPLCQAIKDKKAKDGGSSQPSGAASAVKPPANAGEAGSGPRIGSGFLTPPPIPAGMDWITADKVQTLHSLYHQHDEYQLPDRWEGLKMGLTGTSDPERLKQLDFIIQKPALAPKQAMHQSAVWLQQVRAKLNRCDQLRISTKATLDRHRLHAIEVRTKLEQEDERLAEEATDAECAAHQAQKELEEAQAAHDKEMDTLITPPAPVGKEDLDEDMEAADREEKSKEAMAKELEEKATALAKEMCKKSNGVADSIVVDEDSKRSIAKCVEECHITLRKNSSGQRAAKVARVATDSALAAGIQQQAEEAKKAF
jgi:hypothetical protein